jgi:phosphatidylglycerophosphatase A
MSISGPERRIPAMAIFEQDPDVRRVALGSVSGFLAFGLGSGLLRFAPGTAGTVAAVPLAFALKSLPPWAFWSALALLFAVGVWLCGAVSARLKRHDPGGVVWDEMVAYCLTVAFLPVAWTWWLAALLLFRFFDIAKPWPIGHIERRFGGGLGIMLDDLAAALYAMAVLAVAGRLL